MLCPVENCGKKYRSLYKHFGSLDADSLNKHKTWFVAKYKDIFMDNTKSDRQKAKVIQRLEREVVALKANVDPVKRRSQLKKIAAILGVSMVAATGFSRIVEAASPGSTYAVLSNNAFIPPTVADYSDLPSNPIAGQTFYIEDAGVMALWNAKKNKWVYPSIGSHDGSLTVSAAGIANGLSVLPCDGYDAGPDTILGSTTLEVGTTGLTQTCGIQEVVNIQSINLYGGIVKILTGVFSISTSINLPYEKPVSIIGVGMETSIIQATGSITNGVINFIVPSGLSSSFPNPLPFILQDFQVDCNSKAAWGIYELNNMYPTYLLEQHSIIRVFSQYATTGDFYINGIDLQDDSMISGSQGSSIQSLYFNAVNEAIWLKHFKAYNSKSTVNVLAYALTMTFCIICNISFTGQQLEDFGSNIYAGSTSAITVSPQSSTNSSVVLILIGSAIIIEGGQSQIISLYSTISSMNVNVSLENIIFSVSDSPGFAIMILGGNSGDNFNMISILINGLILESQQSGSIGYNILAHNAGFTAIGTSVQTRGIFNVTPTLLTQDIANEYRVSPTLSTNPPVTATIYQNTNPYDIRIYLPVYATTSGTSGTVAIYESAASTPTIIGTKFISGSTSSTATDIIELVVPAGHYYEFTATGVTIGTAVVKAA